MADYSKMTDAELMALVQPKSSDYSKMSDEDLLKAVGQKPQSSVVGDFFRSIPRGLMSGFSTAASAIGRATQAEMGQDVDAPTPDQGLAIMEKEVTGPLHQPEGRAGKFGAAIGEALGNPGSYVGPGGLPLKVGTAIGGAIGGEGARQAAEGTRYEMPAQLAGNAIGGGLSAVRKGATIPTAEELKAAGKAGYRTAQQTGLQVDAHGVSKASSILRADLEQQGLNAELAPKTFSQLDKLEKPPQGAYADVNNFRTAQRVFGNIENDSKNPITGQYTSESVAALQAKKALGDYLENIPKSDVIAGDPAAASAAIKEANANYGAGARSDVLGSKLERAAIRASAANSGQNVANNTRQRIADILLNPKLSAGYSADELSQARRAVEGTATGNTLRRVANLLGAGGGSGQLLTSAVGAGLGAGAGLLAGDSRTGGAGGAFGAVGLPLLGLLAKGGHNASVMRQARILDEMIRARSPLAEQIAASAPNRSGEMTAAIARALMTNQ